MAQEKVACQVRHRRDAGVPRGITEVPEGLPALRFLVQQPQRVLGQHHRGHLLQLARRLALLVSHHALDVLVGDPIELHQPRVDRRHVRAGVEDEDGSIGARLVEISGREAWLTLEIDRVEPQHDQRGVGALRIHPGGQLLQPRLERAIGLDPRRYVAVREDAIEVGGHGEDPCEPLSGVRVRLDEARDEDVLREGVVHHRRRRDPRRELFQRAHAEDASLAHGHVRRHGVAGVHGDDLLGLVNGDLAHCISRFVRRGIPHPRRGRGLDIPGVSDHDSCLPLRCYRLRVPHAMGPWSYRRGRARPQTRERKPHGDRRRLRGRAMSAPRSARSLQLEARARGRGRGFFDPSAGSSVLATSCTCSRSCCA